MGITDQIAGYILQALSEADGVTEVQRAILAEKFGCVPSQINYVISTRFTPEHGYLVESRRGGGGYIRITRVRLNRQGLIMHTVNAVGEHLSAGEAVVFLKNLTQAGAIQDQHQRIIAAATGENALRPLPPLWRDVVRASIFKNALLGVL